MWHMCVDYGGIMAVGYRRSPKQYYMIKIYHDLLGTEYENICFVCGGFGQDGLLVPAFGCIPCTVQRIHQRDSYVTGALKANVTLPP